MTRPCTCHPDDRPPLTGPCPRRFAASECIKAALRPFPHPIYSPEESDDYPPWYRRAFNAFAFAIALAFLALVAAAFWALWTHLWLVPIIAVPLLAWAFVSWITQP